MTKLGSSGYWYACVMPVVSPCMIQLYAGHYLLFRVYSIHSTSPYIRHHAQQYNSLGLAQQRAAVQRFDASLEAYTRPCPPRLRSPIELADLKQEAACLKNITAVPSVLLAVQRPDPIALVYREVFGTCTPHDVRVTEAKKMHEVHTLQQ